MLDLGIITVKESKAHRSRGSIGPHPIALTAVLTLTFLAYCASLGYYFVDDDRPQIVTNTTLRAWHFVPRYFTGHVWATIAPRSVGNYYRPLFLLWLRLNYAIFRLQPWGWHLTTVLAHLGVTLLVYFLAARILDDRPTAVVTAGIFGLHPVHIEAVAWVSGVTEPVLGLLLMGSVLCYLNTLEGRSRRGAWLVASLFLYVAALFDKETAVVLPALIFAYEWAFTPRMVNEVAGRALGQRIRTSVRAVAPYIVLTPLYLIPRALALKGLSVTLTPLRLSTIVYTWPSLLCFYFRLLVWPLGLAHWYDVGYVSHPDLVNFVLPTLALVSAGGLMWLWATRASGSALLGPNRSLARVIRFATAWLLIPIIPLLNLRFLPRDGFAHDRYLYLPSVGFALLAALALRGVSIGRAQWLGLPAAQVVLTCALVLLLAVATTAQSLNWSDDLVLSYQGLRAHPESHAFKASVASALAERGAYGDAVRIYRELLAADPNDELVNYNLGFVHYRLHNLDAAEQYLRKAVALNGESPESLMYLGLTELRKGKVDDAEELIHRAVKLNPNAPGVHFARGIALKLQGDLKSAREEFTQELALDPGEQSAKEQIAEIDRNLRTTQGAETPAHTPSKHILSTPSDPEG